ncbi:uncharacterized protein PF11_0207 isoform X1 [Papilio machaon]|uniref:uncharacterized protein PF11_0207 isoform X1 n=2 Tax=Papilio machaon TaxID=76193 RepID=UPI001E6654EB|nr:uncharacterized protein PF11_0207 isoform X1 [Papilio machaon]
MCTMKTLLWCVVTCAVAAVVLSDDIELELQSGLLVKMLREMVNQTKVDTLNLPSNATSIRENITDTFSCENRTYGYYADVDNECQVFHVCLPSQAVTGRNVTFRWSFICPAETVFNQEVLTCTRPRDAISCDESPMYYDVNMEFGKVNDSKEQTKPEDNAPMSNSAPNTEAVSSSPQRWNQANRKKENLVVETLFNDVVPNTKSVKEDIKEYDSKIIDTVKEEIRNYNYNTLQTVNKDFSTVSQNIHDLKEEIKGIEKEIVKITDDIKDTDYEKMQVTKDNTKEIVQYRNEELMNSEASHDNIESHINEGAVALPHVILKKIEEMNAEPVMPVVAEEVIPFVEEVNKEDEDATVAEIDNSRIAAERSLKRTGRKMYRGSLRFRPTL